MANRGQKWLINGQSQLIGLKWLKVHSCWWCLMIVFKQRRRQGLLEHRNYAEWKSNAEYRWSWRNSDDFLCVHRLKNSFDHGRRWYKSCRAKNSKQLGKEAIVTAVGYHWDWLPMVLLSNHWFLPSRVPCRSCMSTLCWATCMDATAPRPVRTSRTSSFCTKHGIHCSCRGSIENTSGSMWDHHHQPRYQLPAIPCRCAIPQLRFTTWVHFPTWVSHQFLPPPFRGQLWAAFLCQCCQQSIFLTSWKWSRCSFTVLKGS